MAESYGIVTIGSVGKMITRSNIRSLDAPKVKTGYLWEYLKEKGRITGYLRPYNSKRLIEDVCRCPSGSEKIMSIIK